MLEEPHDEWFVGYFMLSFKVELDVHDKVGDEGGKVLKVVLVALDE